MEKYITYLFVVTSKNQRLKAKILLPVDNNKPLYPRKEKYLSVIIDENLKWAEHINY